MSKIYGLSYNEKLKSVVRIEALFNQGQSFWHFPFMVYYRISEQNEISAPQILVSVGKRYLKHAVDRNRMKRIVREAYRINKLEILNLAKTLGVALNIGFVYKSKSIQNFETVENSVKQILSQMKDIIAKEKFDN